VGLRGNAGAFRLLISETARKNPARVMQVLKQRVSRRCRRKKKSADQLMLWENARPRAFWQRRYYDFNVFRERSPLVTTRRDEMEVATSVPAAQAFGHGEEP
jgi:hypothetical protein